MPELSFPTVSNTMVDNVSFDNGGISGIGENLHSNAFVDISFPDRGASLIGNQIIGNTVLRAYANGISNLSNTQSEIMNNTVDDSGQGDQYNGYGIGVQALLAATFQTHVLVEGNTVLRSSQTGISNSSTTNRFIANTALGNGFFLNGGDLLDNFGTPCPSMWFGNTYNNAAPACTTVGGHHVIPSPPPSGVVQAARFPARHDGLSNGRTRAPHTRGG